MHENVTIPTPNPDFAVPSESPARKEVIAAEAFLRKLNSVPLALPGTQRVPVKDLKDLFINLVNPNHLDEIDYRFALGRAIKSAIEAGSTNIRKVWDEKTREVNYEGIDMPTLKDLFPDGTTLSLS